MMVLLQPVLPSITIVLLILVTLISGSASIRSAIFYEASSISGYGHLGGGNLLLR